MTDLLEILDKAREYGKRKIFRFRFSTLLGFDSDFYFRTLNRGEILDAYRKVGYCSLVIPDKDRRSKTRFHDIIFKTALIDTEVPVKIGSLLAGVVTQSAESILELSGFIENSKTQNKIIEQAKAYSDSPDSRAEALLMHTFNLHPLEIRSMNYDEFTERVYQAIYIESHLKGNPVYDYLDPEGAKTRIKELKTAPRSNLDEMLQVPKDLKIRGLRYDKDVFAQEDDAKVYKATNNLTPQQQNKLLNMIYGTPKAK